jgi:DNA-binding transcriptional LysR family regulator
MSQSLRRLRTAFDDELFIRTPRGIEPTQLAVSVSTPVHDTLLQIHKLLIAKPAFVPARAERAFNLTMSDAQQLLLLPGLLERMSTEAPRIALRTLPFDRDRVDRQLDDGEVDLVIGYLEDPDSRHPTEELFEEQHMCLFNPKLVKVADPLTLEEYLRYPHVLVAHRGGVTGIVDEQLSRRKGQRTILLTTPYAHAVPYILERVAALAIVPGRLAAHCAKAGTLAVQAPPIKLAPYKIRMRWHARNNGDLGLQWLRKEVQAVAADATSLAPRRRRAPAQ